MGIDPAAAGVSFDRDDGSDHARIPEPVTHLVFSDGLATVSVFVQTQIIRSAPNDVRAGMAQVGSSSAFTSVQSGRKFVAVGETPPATVRFIVDSLRHLSAPAGP